MRLTLRTLLAYLDDVLDPADKEELGKKIESSEFAEDLVHRTRDTVRRLRLSAPQLIGTGVGLDPNTVAEYLDNVMPPNEVGDFERICLESDVHLAEVTACHHVLTMILGQPADVDPLSRQRMYTIATETGDRKRLRVEPAHAAPGTTVAVAAAGQPVQVMPVDAAREPRAVEIPEYLRAGAWWKSWGAIAGLAALVIIGIAILLMAGRGWFGGEPSVAAVSSNAGAPTIETETPEAATVTEPSAPSTPTETADASSTTAAPAQPAALENTTPASPPDTAEATEPDRYATESASPSSPPAAPAASTPVVENPPATETAVPSAGSANLSTQPVNADPTVNVPSAPVGPPASTAPVPPTENGVAPAPDPAAVAAAATPNAPGNVELGAAPSGKPQAPVGPPEVGTYIGGRTVLLRYDGTANAWFRMEPRSAVIAGVRLLALPEFRPRFALLSGLQMDMSGGTQLFVPGEDQPMPDTGSPAAAAEPIPMLELVYGRLLLINPTNTEKRVRLKLDSAAGEAQLGKNATLAIDVERKHVAGRDPRESPAPIECRLYAPDGGVVWKDQAGTKTVDKSSRWTVTAAGTTDPVADPSPPEWIYREPIGQLSEQRYGAPKIESTLVSNVPAETQLLELFQGSKQKEVKSLVARSSMHVGQFVPFVEALRDSEQRANWKSHIDTLRAAMALSPESAERVWQTLVEQRGRPAATDLYKMLCGYTADEIGRTPEQIKEGAVAKLIDFLESDSLDYRVLAVQDLAEITGKRLMPNPAATPAERTQNIRKWRARLEADDLKPVSTAP
jgi:hypothetical protein